jgi:hypothetical protein
MKMTNSANKHSPIGNALDFASSRRDFRHVPQNSNTYWVLCLKQQARRTAAKGRGLHVRPVTAAR